MAEPVTGTSYPVPWDTLPEPNLFYANGGKGRFTRLDEPVRVLSSGREISRGVAAGDGDLLVSNLMDRAHFVHRGVLLERPQDLCRAHL